MIFVQQDCSLIMEKAWEISKIMRDPFGRRSKHKICIGQLIPSFEAGRFGRKAKSWPWTKRIVGLILQKNKLKSEKNSKFRLLTRTAQFVQEFYETSLVLEILPTSIITFYADGLQRIWSLISCPATFLCIFAKLPVNIIC